MDNLKVNNITFKGAYQLKGSTEALDEICWFLQKKKRSLAPNFDFLDFRMIKQTPSPTDRILRNVSAADLNNPTAETVIVDHLLDLISIRNGTMEPFRVPKNTENVDLFLTNADKKVVEPKIINMVEESLASRYRTLNFGERCKALLENLSQMRSSLEKGKPISNIKETVIQQHLAYLNLPQLNSFTAEAVLEKIQKGKFDISNW